MHIWGRNALTGGFQNLSPVAQPEDVTEKGTGMTLRYVLLTAARDEEVFIEKTIRSVIAQTIHPVRWVIVNDGSKDRTADIVAQYVEQYDFIELIMRPGDQPRNFGSKSRAIQDAYSRLVTLDFDCVGNLDADVSLPPDYYENILGIFAADSKVGLAGGIRYEPHNGRLVLVNCARSSVGGPIQMFRRECWEMVGGYMTLPYGGEDAVAETSARMHGWKVRSFPEYRVYHHRKTGTANRSVWSALYRAGIRDYTIGYHPLFELARTVYRFQQRPYVVGSLVMLAGYLSAMLRRFKRLVSPALISFLHKEQLSRLKEAAITKTKNAQ
ncbi:MAG: glycosyltransferase family 2 protein [Chloroflexi bacterium]|nr:glycosyltransferase family 2 protein [Chloroflexota bacterium]